MHRDTTEAPPPGTLLCPGTLAHLKHAGVEAVTFCGVLFLTFFVFACLREHFG